MGFELVGNGIAGYGIGSPLGAGRTASEDADFGNAEIGNFAVSDFDSE